MVALAQPKAKSNVLTFFRQQSISSAMNGAAANAKSHVEVATKVNSSEGGISENSGDGISPHGPGASPKGSTNGEGGTQQGQVPQVKVKTGLLKERILEQREKQTKKRL